MGVMMRCCKVFSLLLLMHMTIFCGCSAASGETVSGHEEEIVLTLSNFTLRFSISDSGAADYSDRRSYIRETDIFNESLYETAASSHVIFSHLWAFKGRLWQGFVGELLGGVLIRKPRSDNVSLEYLYPLSKDKSYIVINGERWMRYEDENEVRYAVSLSKDHFLVVYFSFISGGKSNTWQKEAQSYVDKIVATLNLERH